MIERFDDLELAIEYAKANDYSDIGYTVKACYNLQVAAKELAELVKNFHQSNDWQES